MIEILQESQGKILGIRATGRVTDEDYRKVFIPKLDELISAHENIRVLYLMDKQLEGFDFGAMWDDTKYGFGHKDAWEKIAVVGGPQWVQWGVKLCSYFLKGELRIFSEDELQQAWNWVRE